MSRFVFGGSSDDYVVDSSGKPVPNRRLRFYTSADMTTEITDLASDAAGTGSPLTVRSNTAGFFGPVYGPDGVSVMYVGAETSSGDLPTYAVAVYTHATDLAGAAAAAQAAAIAAAASDATSKVNAVKPTDGQVAVSAAQAAAAPVQSVAGRTGAVVVAKADVGLGNVDNTADTAKPVSTAQATAIAGRAPVSATWQANAAYKAGQVVSYLGTLYTAIADFTAGSSFNVANWTLASSGASVATAAVSKAAGGAARAVAPALSDALVRRTVGELETFASWLNGKQGLVGEFGIPVAATDVTSWLTLLDIFYSVADGAGIHLTSWGTGKWLADNSRGNSMQFYVKKLAADTVVNFASSAALISERHQESTGGPVRGTNFAGIDWGGARGAQTASFIPSLADLQYLYGRGVRTIRLPSQWENLQPTLGGALDTTEMALLDGVLQNCATVGMQVILECAHNYGGYLLLGGSSATKLTRAGSSPNAADLADFWTRVRAWVVANANRNTVVRCFDIMNEPTGLRAELGTPGAVTIGFEDGTTSGFAGVSGSLALSNITTTVDSGTNALQIDMNSNVQNFAQIQCPNVSNAAVGALAGAGVTVRLYCPPSAVGAYAFLTVQDQANAQHLEAPTVLVSGWNTLQAPTNYTGVTNLLLTFGSVPLAASQKFVLDSIAPTPLVYTAPQVWQEITKVVVAALRAAGETRPIAVPTYEYSLMHLLTAQHPSGPWITDPLDNIWYECHSYWDNQRAGLFAAAVGGGTETYAEELGNVQKAQRTLALVTGPMPGHQAPGGAPLSAATTITGSSDGAGRMTGTTNTLTAGQQITNMVFSSPLSAIPRVVLLQANNAGTAAMGLYVGSRAADRFTVYAANATASGVALDFSWIVVP